MKRVLLLRHGESFAQGFSRRERWNPESTFLHDAPLGPVGEAQARELALRLGDEKPELVVCSPLTRALQTALLAFGRALPHAGLRELAPRGYGTVGSRQQPECRGRPLAELLEDQRFQAGEVDWSLMREEPDVWWSEVMESSDHVERRLDSFCEWLGERPETSIAVVCHFNVVQRLLKAPGLKVTNCEPMLCHAHGRKWELLELRALGNRVAKEDADAEPATRSIASQQAELHPERPERTGRRWKPRGTREEEQA